MNSIFNRTFLKNLAWYLIALTLTVIAMCMFQSSFAQDSTAIGGADAGGSSVEGFLKEHWVAVSTALLVFIDVIVRLTPSEKDNSIFNLFKMVYDVIIPNLASKKIGGGKLGYLPPKDATTKNSQVISK